MTTPLDDNVSGYLRRPLRSLADIEAERYCLPSFVLDCKTAADCDTAHFEAMATAKFWELHAAAMAEGDTHEQACFRVYDHEISDMIDMLERHKNYCLSLKWPDYLWDRGFD
jgi:hypothetical protein